MSTQKNRSFDAVSMLGFGRARKNMPTPNNQEIVIRYGGWTLEELFQNKVVRESKLLYRIHEWMEDEWWYRRRLKKGIHRLRIPANDDRTEGRTFEEVQKNCLYNYEEPAPLVLLATAAVVYRMEHGENILRDGGDVWCTDKVGSYHITTMYLPARGNESQTIGFGHTYAVDWQQTGYKVVASHWKDVGR